MVSHKKVPLSGIKTLTFYADQKTAGRRTKPIPQLSCVGSACDIFRPEVVQCTNMGDDGLGGVQWRCDTDLPSSLRLGKTEVSCEGWSKAGDLNVLQGSCGLTYDLHRVNKGLEYGEHPSIPPRSNDLANKAFNLLFYLVSGIILYSLLRSFLQRFTGRHLPTVASFFPGSSGGGGGDGSGGGWGPGPGPGFNGGQGGGRAPPPYTKDPTTNPSSGSGSGPGSGMNPGFWTGLGAGALGAYLTTRSRGEQSQPPPPQRAGSGYGQGQARIYTTRRRVVDSFDDEYDNDDYRRGRGVGGSAGGGGMGEMRRATGFGGSSTR